MVEISANVDGILQSIQTVYITGWAEDCHGVKIDITEIFYDVGDRNWQPLEHLEYALQEMAVMLILPLCIR